MKKINNYIHGKSVSISKNEADIYDPSTGEIISKVVLSENDDFKSVPGNRSAQWLKLKRFEHLLGLEINAADE